MNSSSSTDRDRRLVARGVVALFSLVFCAALVSADDSIPPPDPGPFLRQVADLKGERLVVFLQNLKGVYRSYTRVVTHDRYRALVDLRKGMVASMRRAGLDPVAARAFRQALPRWLEGAYPEDARAEEVVALRYGESVIADTLGVQPPWGSIDVALGFDAQPTPEAVLRAGWRRVGHRSLMIKAPPGPGELRGYATWIWLRSRSMASDTVGSDGASMVHGATPLMATLPDEVGVPPRDWKDHVVAKVTVDTARAMWWPPAEAAVVLELRGLVREYVLVVRVNDGPPAHVVNTTPLLTDDIDFYGMDTFEFVIPFSPKRLRPGENEITIDVRSVPHEKPVFACRLGAVGLYVK